jgi:hypothetical protein
MSAKLVRDVVTLGIVVYFVMHGGQWWMAGIVGAMCQWLLGAFKQGGVS